MAMPMGASGAGLSESCSQKGFRRKWVQFCEPAAAPAKVRRMGKQAPWAISENPTHKTSGIVLSDSETATCPDSSRPTATVQIDFHRSISPNRLTGLIASAMTTQLPDAYRKHLNGKGGIQSQIWRYDYGRRKYRGSTMGGQHSCMNQYGDDYCTCFAQMNARLSELLLKEEGRTDVHFRRELFTSSATDLRAHAKDSKRKWYLPLTRGRIERWKRQTEEFPSGCFTVFKSRTTQLDPLSPANSPSTGISYLHIGLALGIRTDGQLETIEGNTDCLEFGKGNEGVCRKTRKLQAIDDKKIAVGDTGLIDGFACPFDPDSSDSDAARMTEETLSGGKLPEECMTSDFQNTPDCLR
jgi:hypothetical protein